MTKCYVQLPQWNLLHNLGTNQPIASIFLLHTITHQFIDFQSYLDFHKMGCVRFSLSRSHLRNKRQQKTGAKMLLSALHSVFTASIKSYLVSVS